MSQYGPTPDRRVTRSHINPPPSLPSRPYPTSRQSNNRAPTPSSNQPPRPPARVAQSRQPPALFSRPPLNYPQSQPSYVPTTNAHSNSYRGYNSSSSIPASSYPRPHHAAYDEQQEPLSSPPSSLHASAHPTHRHRGQQRSERSSPDTSRPQSPSKRKRQLLCSSRTVFLSIVGCLFLLVLLFVVSSYPSLSLSSLFTSRRPTVVKHSRPLDAVIGGELPDVGDIDAAHHPIVHTMAVPEGEDAAQQAAVTEVLAADEPVAPIAQAAVEGAEAEAANQPEIPLPAVEVAKDGEAPAVLQLEVATPVVAIADEGAAPAPAAVPTPSTAEVPQPVSVPVPEAPPALPTPAAGPAADTPPVPAAPAATPDAAAAQPTPPLPATPATPATPASVDAPAAADVSAPVQLSYTPNPVMTSSLFPKTADGYPVFSSPSTPLYSNFYCIGGRGREGSQGDRSCRWQNLCYRPADNQWLFYQDPSSKGDMPVLLDHGMIISAFPKQFLNLRSMGNAPDAQYWAPTQVYEAIPAEAMVPRRTAERPDVYLLYHPHYPSNIGHVLGDDFFPLFNLQLSFNMLSNDNQLLMVRSCEDIFLPGAPKKAAACHKFMQMLTPGMSDRPFLAATQSDLRERLGMKADAQLVCFENVLTGNGPWGFQQSLGKSPAWWQYHAYYLSNMGVPYNHTPKKHRITVSIKDGKRSIYNSAEMVQHLKQAFPNHEVDAIELYQLGGWKNELTYLLDTTVLITPCGGVSMSAMFLPHGSALVVVDFWDVLKGNTKGMEERLWSNLGYVRSFHYPFVESEVMLEEEGKKRSEPQDMRDWGRVRVDVVRMEKVVRAAIAHVDSFMVMGQE